MNPLLRILAVGSLITAAQTFAADAFEGKVSLAITTDKGHAQEVNYTIKGQKLRLDMMADKHAACMIMDLEKLEMLMLMPEQNMYMVMPIKQPVQQAGAHEERDRSKELNVDIQRTGKTEKILGYTCDQILITDKQKGTVTELWVASGLGTFMGLGGGGPMGGGGMFGGPRASNSAQAAKWEEVMKGKPGFPLRVVTHDPKGDQSFKMEATKIDTGSQPDSLFVPPPGYQKFQMPDLGGLNPFKQG